MIIGLEMKEKKISRCLDQWIKKMKCSGESGLGIESFKDVLVGVDGSKVENGCESYDPVTDSGSFKGLEGNIAIKLENGDTVEGMFKDGLRHGICKVTSYRTKVSKIIGDYKDGTLNGKAKVKFHDRTMIVGYFKAGILHGFARYFDKKGRLTFIGNHRNGCPEGTCWKIIRGGGCVVGRVNSAGKLTGSDIAYIYPDYMTALVGVFKEGEMVTAEEAEITDVIEDNAGVKIPIFCKHEGHMHIRQDRIGDPDLLLDPTTRDPYESKMVELRTSDIPEANEGLFANVSIEMNTTVAFYNGTPARAEDFDPNTWDTNSYKIFDPANVPRGTIDIPPWAQVSYSIPMQYVILVAVFRRILCITCSQDKPQLPAKCTVHCV